MILPILAAALAVAALLLSKKAAAEKQSVAFSYILFAFTYWFLASMCWLSAAYYKVSNKKIKWGERYL